MNEEALRDKTLEIAKAYIEISEEIDGLCLDDFLKIRKLAGKELKKDNFMSSKGSSIKAMPVISENKKPAPKPLPLKEESKVVPKREIRKPKQPLPEAIDDDIKEEAAGSEGDVVKPSKFDLLRSFPDEWN